MKKSLLVLSWALSLVVVFGLTYGYAERRVKTVLGTELNEIQAMLWFDHLRTYSDIDNYLNRGCTEEASKLVKIAIDQESQLLSEFHRKYPQSATNQYFSDRDPDFLARISNFKSFLGRSWMRPKCDK